MDSISEPAPNNHAMSGAAPKAAIEAAVEPRAERRRLRRLRDWLARAGRAIKPGPRAWKGAAWALVAATLILFGISSWAILATPAFNAAAPLVLGAVVLAVAIFGGLVVLLLVLLKLPTLFYRWVLASCGALLVLLFGLGGSGTAICASAVVLAASLFGAGIWVLAHGGLRDATRTQKAVAAGGLLLGLAAIGAGATWLALSGWETKQVPNAAAQAAGSARITRLNLPDPSKPGPYRVKTLFYGSGKDRYRPEYGKSAVLVTTPVDGSELVENWKGRAGWARTRFWRFDAKQLPLQARVWYPEGDGPFPLVLTVHGNHLMEEFSDPGYAYLGELLASRGYIFASVDENFLNSSLTDLLGIPKVGLKEENDARGWLLLEHLRTWQKWNETPGNPFHGKVDMGNLGLIGHSRGGEAVTVASVFNRLPYYPDNARVKFSYHFAIRAVVAIAPVDGQYKPAGTSAKPENINYFVLHGSHDADMRSYHGERVYERVRFTDGGYWFKAGLYVHGANHGQFNRSWGRSDTRGLGTLLLNLRQLMPEQDQEQVAKVYISAFLDAALRRQTGYLPLFRDHRVAPGWLPAGIYLHQFADSSTQMVSTFEEDLDLTTTTLPGGSAIGANLADWKEKEVPIKWGSLDTRAVYLGWNSREWKETASYTVNLPEKGLALNKDSVLVFALADAKDKPSPRDKDKEEKEKKKEEEKEKEPREPIDLTVEVADRAGATARLPLSSVSYLQPQIEAQVAKASFLNDTPTSEVVFQIFEFPLSRFMAVNPALDPGKLKSVRFIFDRTPKGLVILDDLGFRPTTAGVR